MGSDPPTTASHPSLPIAVTADELWATSPDALIVAESGGRIIAANGAADRLFAMPAGSMVGRTIEDLLPGPARDRHRSLRQGFEADPHPRLMGTGQRLEGLNADGRVFPVHVSLAPLGPNTGLTLAAIRDMTAWVDAERQLEEARRRSDRAEDHERIARDLHDRVIQELFAAGLALQSLQATADTTTADRLAEIVRGLDDTTRTIRAVIFDLSSPVHSIHGLRSRATEIVDSMVEMLGVEPRCHFTGPLDTAVPDDLVEEAVIVVREMLTNVARHAEASSVTLGIAVDDLLTIEVVDDGIGLPDGSIRRSGLANLEDRARRRWGTFNASSAPAGGTVARWSVPVLDLG